VPQGYVLRPLIFLKVLLISVSGEAFLHVTGMAATLTSGT